jgi:hypothetical protein
MIGLREETITHRELRSGARDLYRSLISELRVGTFFRTSKESATRIAKPAAGWDRVIEKWPKLRREIEESNLCLAYGLYTATVFHLMRVMESGVQQFARRLKVKFNPNKSTWLQILRDTHKAIEALPSKTLNQQQRKQAYHGAYAHLSSVGHAWRNPTMHPRESYGAEQALEIYDHAKSFMTMLARIL